MVFNDVFNCRKKSIYTCEGVKCFNKFELTSKVRAKQFVNRKRIRTKLCILEHFFYFSENLKVIVDIIDTNDIRSHFRIYPENSSRLEQKFDYFSVNN